MAGMRDRLIHDYFTPLAVRASGALASSSTSSLPMVDLVLARALARDPSERHATIGEFQKRKRLKLAVTSAPVPPVSRAPNLT